jgi:hypothetical protein
MSTIAIFGSFVLSRKDGAQDVLRDRWVLLEGKKVAAVTPSSSFPKFESFQAASSSL